MAVLALLATSLGVAGPLRPADAQTPAAPAAPVVGSTASACAPTGFTKPVFGAPPGYIYTPTSFNGVAVDPQPDDTFAADSPGHTAFTGRLQTRMANGREEFLVCAHVGTNTLDDALTPFPTSAHPATIAPRVSVIDAAGTTVSYDLETAGLTDVALARYAGSTDAREGILQMWVPFTPSLHSPGFTVRTEIRGTAALAGGGTSLVGGADEVYIHLGLAPVARNAAVDQAVGVAIDDSAIAERSTDPGADDLQSLLKPLLPPMLKDAVAAQAPSNIPADWEWSPGIALGTSASGTLNELPFYGGLSSLNVVDFNAQESRLQLRITGTMYPKLTLKPRAAGFVSILSGSCDVTAQVAVTMDIGVTLGFDATATKLQTQIYVLSASGVTSNVQSSGTLLALYLLAPGPLSCHTINGDISSGITKKMEERLSGLQGNATIQDQIAEALNTSAPLGLTDLANGPISTAQVTLPSGAGFGIGSAKYVQTAPYGHLGGNVWIWHEGIDAAASLAVTDLGGVRFPYSMRPSSNCSVVTQTHQRTRPKAPSIFDPTTAFGCQGGVIATDLVTAPVTSPTTAPTTTPTTTPPIGPIATVPTKGVVAPAPAPTPSPTTTTPVKSATVAPARVTTQVAAQGTAQVAAQGTAPSAAEADASASAPVVGQVPTAPVATVPPTTTTPATTTPATTAPTTTAPTRTTTAPTTTAPTRTTTAPTTTAPTKTTTTTAPTTTPVIAQPIVGKAPTTVTAPTSPVARIGGIDVTPICCLTIDPGTTPPTDFDVGVIVNGATVNQLSRAFTAGGGVGTGILDVDTTDESMNAVRARPSVAPMYLPNAPANWPAPGAVKLFVPSVRLTNSSNPFMMAADMLVGANVQINTATNHLVPLPSSTIAVRARFLRLAAGNMAVEPPAPSVQTAVGNLESLIGPRALKILEGVAVPDLGKLLVNSGLPSMVASNLTVATTGGGHLGVYLNIDPNPARVGVAVSWSGGTDTTAPTSFRATATPTGFPGTGGYTVHWTVRTASNIVKYQSPAAGETSLTKSFSATLASGSENDVCDGTRALAVKVTATVTRNNVTNTGTASSVSPTWEVPINPHACWDDENP